MRVEISSVTTESAMFDLLTSCWGEPIVVVRYDGAPSAVENCIYYMWVLGYPIAAISPHQTADETTITPLKWQRPVIARVEHAELVKVISSRLVFYAPKYEMVAASALDVRRAIIEASAFNDIDYMLPLHITKVVIAYGKETPPLPKADIYFLFSQLLFHYIPDEHVPQDIVVCETKPIFLNDVKSSRKWSARQPIACVIDKRMLNANDIEHTIRCCEKMNIPTISPNPDEAEQFKIVLYPVSERMMHYSLPRTFTEILGRFTFIITTAKGALFYPMVYRDVSYAQDGELIAHCLLAYAAYKEILENDAVFRFTEFTEFLKQCTWEGLLYKMVGEHSGVFITE